MLSDAVIYIEILVLILVTGAVRNLPRAFTPGWRNADAYVHFIIMREIRARRYRIPESVSQSLLPGRFSYPCFVHWILSVIPERYYDIIDEQFSGVADVIFGILVVSLVPLGLLTLGEVLVVLVLFVATPQFGRPDHPHGVGFSSRKPGLMLYTAAVVSFLMWYDGGQAVFLGASLFFGALIVLTSRFSLQAAVFTFGGFTLFLTPTAALVFAGWGVLSVLLSNGFAIRVLSDHLYYMYEYATGQQYTRFYNGLKSVDTLKRLLRVRGVRDLQKTIFESILLRAVIDNPFVVLVGFAGYAVWTGEVSVSLLPGTWVWILSGMFATVLTGSYHFRFIGAADRYLEHVFLPGAILVARILVAAPSWYRFLFAAAIVWGVCVIIAYFWFHIHIRNYSPEQAEDVRKMADFLDEYDAGNVICQPRELGSEIAWRTSHHVNDFIGNVTRSVADVEKRQQMFPEKETWVTGDVAWLSEEFDPDWVVFKRKPDGPGIEPPETDPLYQNEYVSLYRFEDILLADAHN